MKLTHLILMLLSINVAFAGISDTCRDSKEIKISSPEFICANIVFPEILCGEEEKALDYVAKFSNARREYLIRMYNKSRKYRSTVIKALKRQGVPEEFWVLMALESAFNGNAVSKAGAVGFWQFMGPVAKEYGLKVGSNNYHKEKGKKVVARGKHIVDERKNFYKSTAAAARYLKDRSMNLNSDWLLMAASYNCGIGNVWNAMKKTKKESPTFWDIKKFLPKETQAYVMNFIALNVIYYNYEQFLNNELIFHDIAISPEETEKPEPEVSLAGL